jgi:hypothetical protein
MMSNQETEQLHAHDDDKMKQQASKQGQHRYDL